jgi:hypothetical protein
MVLVDYSCYARHIEGMESDGRKRDEHLYRSYNKEEEFLDLYPSVISPAIEAVRPDEWEPDWDCNDNRRQQRDYFKKSGELKRLTFDYAAIYHDSAGMLSSVQIVLVDSDRTITVRVRKTTGCFEAKRL